MRKGFTLAELLMALVILGVIATFTIPKVLTSQSDAKSKAVTKEVAAALSEAFQKYKLERGSAFNMSGTHLTPYLNYVVSDSISLIDFHNDGTTRTCSAANKVCIKLHNGGILQVDTNDYMGSTAATQALPFQFDPNGIVDGANKPGTAVQLWVYYDGKMRTKGTIEPNTCVAAACTYSPNTAHDPPWFSWN